MNEIDNLEDLPVVGEVPPPRAVAEVQAEVAAAKETPAPDEAPREQWPDRPFYLPDKAQTPLLLTAAAAAVLHDLFRRPDRPFFWPDTMHEALTLLWFCSHDRSEWGRPGRTEDGRRVEPLFLRPFDLADEVQAWADREFSARDVAQLHGLALELWVHHHEAYVHADDAGTPPVEGTQKKTEEERDPR